MGLVVASSYPLLDVFWTVLLIAGLFLWLWLVVAVFIDIFRSRDLAGWAKAVWTLAVLALPLAGVVAYLVARGGSMPDRVIAEAERQDEEAQAYVRRQTANRSKPGAADELARLAALRDSGALSPAEFEQQKERLLSHA